MKRATTAVLGMGLSLFWASPSAGQSNPASTPQIRIAKGERSLVQLSFPTVAGKKYQLTLSQDLRDWFPLGDLVNGTGNTVVIEYNAAGKTTGYFRVEP